MTSFIRTLVERIDIGGFEYTNEPVNLEMVAVISKNEYPLGPEQLAKTKAKYLFCISFYNHIKNVICEWTFETQTQRDQVYQTLLSQIQVIEQI